MNLGARAIDVSEASLSCDGNYLVCQETEEFRPMTDGRVKWQFWPVTNDHLDAVCADGRL